MTISDGVFVCVYVSFFMKFGLFFVNHSFRLNHDIGDVLLRSIEKLKCIIGPNA